MKPSTSGRWYSYPLLSSVYFRIPSEPILQKNNYNWQLWINEKPLKIIQTFFLFVFLNKISVGCKLYFDIYFGILVIKTFITNSENMEIYSKSKHTFRYFKSIYIWINLIIPLISHLRVFYVYWLNYYFISNSL